MLYVIIVIIFIILVFAGKAGHEKQIKLDKENINFYKNLGISKSESFYSGNYIGGHPDIDKYNFCTSIFDINDKIIIIANDFKAGSNIATSIDEIKRDNPIMLGYISKVSISDITIEDHSSIERKVTVGRLLLLGPLAFGMKKKIEHKEAFLNIIWSDGKFTHNTLFQFGDFQQANLSRNQLIRIIN